MNMEVLFVSRKAASGINPFVAEQASAITDRCGITVQHFLITRGGVVGYWQAIVALRQMVRNHAIQLVHVHYGLWAFTAIAARFLARRRIPIVITFHGSDLNKPKERSVSVLASRFAAHNILVWPQMRQYVKKNYSIIPCGVQTNVPLIYRDETRNEMGWSAATFVVLFASSFDRPVKDPAFANEVVATLRQQTQLPTVFVEMKGFNRRQLNRMMQAADALLMCSHSEGSPQVIKEAIVNGLPVVANNVGEVGDICAGVDHCYILPKNIPAYVQCLQALMQSKKRINCRQPVVDRYDANMIADRIASIYTRVAAKKPQSQPTVLQHQTETNLTHSHEHSH